MTAGPLRIESSLTFTVDGPEGASAGRVEASGSRVTIHATDPVSVLQGALGVGDRSSRTSVLVGDFLATMGVTVDLVGPHGSVVTMGAGVDSALGALVSGSRHLRLGSLRVAGSLALSRATPPAYVRRPLAFGAAAALVLLIADRARRHRRQR